MNPVFPVVTALAAASVTWSYANSTATGDQDGPAVAANRNGAVAVVWEDDRDTTDPADDDHSDIWIRYYRDGSPAYEKKLSAGGTSGTAWTHRTPDVALDDRGNAIVVWSDDPDGNAVFNIPYQVLSPAGALLGSGRANADVAGDQVRPRVAADPDGAPGNASAVAFTVVWEDVQGGTVTARAAGFTGATTKAYERTAGPGRRPDVAVSATGDATVVWEGSGGVTLTRLARTSGAVSLTARPIGTGLRPAAAADSTGDLTVAWESGAAVKARSFTPAAAPRHDEVQVTADGATPAVGVDDQGFAVVGWTTGGVDGWLRGLNPDGTTAGRLTTQKLTQTETGRQDQYTLAVSPWAEVTVCYTDDSDGNGWDQVALGTGATNNDGGWLRRQAAARSRSAS